MVCFTIGLKSPLGHENKNTQACTHKQSSNFNPNFLAAAHVSLLSGSVKSTTQTSFTTLG